MQPYKETTKKCAVCGEESVQQELAFVRTSGESDLDGRPGPLIRDTMRYWLMECPECGFIAEDIAIDPKVARDKIMDKYRPFDELTDTPVAARFAKFARYQIWHGEMHKACDYFLYAAWACDDMGEIGRARAMRLFALDIANDLAASLLPHRRAYYMLIKADLLRRIKNYDKLLEMDENDESLGPNDRLKLRWEKELALLGDYHSHNLEERPELLLQQ